MTKRFEKVMPCWNLDARDLIAEKIEIGTHRQRGIRGDPVRGQQVCVPGRVDAELEDHRRRRRTFKGYVEARFDQHKAAPRRAMMIPTMPRPRLGAARTGAVGNVTRRIRVRGKGRGD
jgi:hypothetical protein